MRLVFGDLRWMEPICCVLFAGVFVACGGNNEEMKEEAGSPDVTLVVTTPVAIEPLQGGGTINGTVTLDGVAPPVETYTPNKDAEVCGAEERTAEDILLGPEQGIKNVVVSITNLSKPVALDRSITGMMDQKGCLFTPHIVQVAAGAPMTFLNNDHMLHNIHTISEANLSTNKAQPGFMKKMTGTFSLPEMIKVQCDVHSWMSAWIVVQEHPFYAVTDEQGLFTMAHVPPGIYTLKYRHERFGEQRQEVEVREAETTPADLAFIPPASP
ncbi:MAG: carboxypeptidase regulatory-like domain-containing protein [Candidatus Latescibacteria bacterium]|nr:carboxypeptidase regulatory-like domain-containing protein [Candidatus Latescibacterota bacterium]MDP7238563.1 carboxypeptidase regulatory-like domain-containing protein [Candidatus Latescibacterota bacterium]